MVAKIQNYAQAGSTVTPVSSASSTGVASSYALADHAHAGIVNVGMAGNTSGASTLLSGSLVIAGGSNVTLSATTAAGAMTVSVIGVALSSSVNTTSSYWLPGVLCGSFASFFNGVGLAACPIFPVDMSSQITVTAFKSLLFNQSYSASTTAGGTVSVTGAIYSIDIANSSYVQIASGSFSQSQSISVASASSLYIGDRITSIAMNTPVTLSQGVKYAVGFAYSTAGIVQRFSMYLVSNGAGYADLSYEAGGWGVLPSGTVSNSSFLPSGAPCARIVASTLAVSIPFASVTNGTVGRFPIMAFA